MPAAFSASVNLTAALPSGSTDTHFMESNATGLMNGFDDFGERVRFSGTGASAKDSNSTGRRNCILLTLVISAAF